MRHVVPWKVSLELPLIEIFVDGFDTHFYFRTTRNAKLDVLGFS
jgi:hypothetical protein